MWQSNLTNTEHPALSLGRWRLGYAGESRCRATGKGKEEESWHGFRVYGMNIRSNTLVCVCV